jgi:hypothetical protein
VSGTSHISYTPHFDTTPEAELSALTNVYRFILDCHAKKEAAPDSRPDDAMKGSKDDRARTIIPER